jgi:hypothetical protein
VFELSDGKSGYRVLIYTHEARARLNSRDLTRFPFQIMNSRATLYQLRSPSIVSTLTAQRPEGLPG